MKKFDASDLEVIESWKKRMKEGAILKVPEKDVVSLDFRVMNMVLWVYGRLGCTSDELSVDVLFPIVKEEVLRLEAMK